MKAKNQTLRDFLELHFIVFIWGFTAILGVLITATPLVLVLWRTFYTSIALVVMLFFARISFRVSSLDLLKLSATGLVIALHWFTFFYAARVSNVSVCLAGLSTVSLWTSFLEPFVNKSKIKSFEVVLGCIVIVGIYSIYYFQGNYWFGLMIGIVSAFLSALFSVINARFVKRMHAYTITFYEMASACGCILVVALLQLFYGHTTLEEVVPSWNDTGWLLILALLCTVYPFSASVELMKRLSAYAVNLTVNLEPVYGILLAIVLLGENKVLNIGFYLGTGLILSSVLLYPWLSKRHQRSNA